ncbi:MAG: adenosylmethionine--8-amino-7-oxononanoate transaminase [Pyrinomonadaceae bacterium]|nr:adenosylmethionine--8-amino-7-oxononanoate transaminase [Pyrinomonadaceae bacterium]
MTILEKDRKYLWHPYTQEKVAPLPVPIVKAEGVWLYTEDGRKLLDGVSSWWVNTHGHSHPYLNEALRKQAETLEHVIFAGFTHEPAVKLGEKLVEVLPEGLTKVFYSDNGSTAVEVALKMAYQYWRNKGEERRTFIALEHAYHGDTIGAMSASDDSQFTAPFKDLLFEVKRAEAPYALHCRRCAVGSPESGVQSPENRSVPSAVADGLIPNPQKNKCNLDCLESLESILKKHHIETAAVIIEPMLQGAGGMIVWEKEYLAQVRELCDKYSVLLIADEVLTGFGRTGKMFACEHANISPDIICLSKALTAGYMPLGATAATEEIFDAFYDDDRLKTFFHGHSYCANPLACALGIANLELFEKEDTLKKIQFINKKFREFEPELYSFDGVQDVRIIGGVLAFELKVDEGGYLADIGQELYQEFLGRDIVLRPLGNVLLFMPPYIIEEKEIDWVLGEIRSVLQGISEKDSELAKSA